MTAFRMLVATVHDHWPCIGLLLAFRNEALERALRARGRHADPYTVALRTLIRAGHFDAHIYLDACPNCGGRVTIWPCPTRGRGNVVGAETINLCEVCRFDRVKRWRQLFEASIRFQRSLRTVPPGEGDPVGLQHLFAYLDRGYSREAPRARVLEQAGIVSYDKAEGAWDLTPLGTSLLVELDLAGAELDHACAAKELERQRREYWRSIESEVRAGLYVTDVAFRRLVLRDELRAQLVAVLTRRIAA